MTLDLFAKLRAGKSKPEPFEFLGFTFVMGKLRKGMPVPKLKTSSKRLLQKVKIVSEWIKAHRSKVKLKPLWQALCRALPVLNKLILLSCRAFAGPLTSRSNPLAHLSEMHFF